MTASRAVAAARDRVKAEGGDPARFTASATRTDGAWYVQFDEKTPANPQSPVRFYVRVEPDGSAVLLKTGWFRQAAAENHRKVVSETPP